MKCVYVAALFLIAVSTTSAFQEEMPRSYCGRHLASVRALYCYGATENMRKRSNINSSLILELLHPQNYLGYQSSKIRSPAVKTLLNAVSMPTNRMSIVDECCLKPCQINELLNYC